MGKHRVCLCVYVCLCQPLCGQLYSMYVQIVSASVNWLIDNNDILNTKGFSFEERKTKLNKQDEIEKTQEMKINSNYHIKYQIND